MKFGRIRVDRKWIAVGVALLLLLSYIVMIAAHRNKSAKTVPVVTDENGNPIDGQDGLYGQTALLFYFRDTDGSGMIFGVNADLTNRKISVAALPDDKNYMLNGTAVSFGTVYAGSGLEGVKEAAGRRMGTVFRRAYICTPAQFARVTETLGKVDAYLPEAFSRVDSTAAVNLKAGANRLSGADLYQYLKYGGGEEISYELRGDLFAAMLGAYLTVDNAGQGEKLFNELVNAAETDITVYDYTAWADRIAAAAASETLVIENAGLFGSAESDG